MEYKKTIFQQYSAPIRTAATTKKWFQHFRMVSLPCVILDIETRSGPDPENLSGIVARKV